MYKKWIALALALCLCLSLAACAQTPASSTQPASSTAVESKDASSVETEKELYPIVDSPITVNGVIFGSLDMTNERVTWKMMEHVTNIHVEWKRIDGEQKAVFLAANSWPDLFHNGIDRNTVEEYGVLGKKLVNFEDYTEYMPNLQQAYKDYENSKQLVMSSNGGVYALVRVTDSPTDAACRWQYRMDMLTNNGLQVPKTVDEYFNVLMALKNVTGAAPMADNFAPKYGLQNTPCGEWFFYAAFGTSTNPNFEDDGTGKVIYNRNSDQYRYYLQYMNKLYANGLLHQEYLTLDSSTKKSLIESGKTIFGSDAWGNVGKEVFTNGFSDLKQLPPLTSEYDGTQTVAAYPHAKSSDFAIYSGSKYVKELCRMMDIIYATEEVVEGTGLYGIAFTYGPENVTWKWANDAHTEFNFILPEGYNETASVYQYANVIYVNMGRFDTFAKAVTAEDSNNRARQLSYIEDLIPYQEKVQFPSTNMSLTDDEKTVIDNYLTELQGYVSEWNAAFITGTKNPNDDAVWSEYCAGFDKLHLTEVTAAYQSAYTRFSTLD